MAKFFTVEQIPGAKFPWYGRPIIEDWIKLKQFVYERDKGTCQYCQQKTEYHKSHCHHVLELGEHGTNHPTNLKTVCHKCHERKHPFMMNPRERIEQ